MTRDGAPLTIRSAAASYRGVVYETGAAVFAGIPFAEAPVGALRFRPPRPLVDHTGVIDATRFRSAPAQQGSALSAAATDVAAEGPVPELASLVGPEAAFETSEDCLYLNVWTPDVEGSLPVIVWIYGGGFDSGSAAPPSTDGAALSRLTGAVVVSVNYRVGALGFGYWRGVGGDGWAESSNLGLQDQIAGLAWIRRNINAFGGNSANVTIAGESAGAFCIGSLLAIPSARELFGKAIMHSGSTRRVFPASTADRIAQDLMARVGADTMEQLQHVGVDTILAVQSEVVDDDIGRRNLPGGRSWGVVADGHVLLDDPYAAMARGDARDIPILLGANRDETMLFAAMMGAQWVPAGDAALLEEIGRTDAADPHAVLAAYRTQAGPASGSLSAVRTAFLSDAIYRRPAIETVLAQQRGGGKAWSYLFSGEPLGPTVGAGHGMDLLYVFDHLDAIGQATPANRAIQKDLTQAWSEFAGTGNPGWPEYNYDSPNSTRQFGGDTAFVTEPPIGALRQTWPLQRA